MFTLSYLKLVVLVLDLAMELPCVLSVSACQDKGTSTDQQQPDAPSKSQLFSVWLHLASTMTALLFIFGERERREGEGAKKEKKRKEKKWRAN